jgi:hypothetical protein
MIEDRGSPRQNKCFFRGFVYFGGVLTAVDCVVRDISETGARLQFALPQNFNGYLDLHIPIKGQSFHAKIRWHDGVEMGVQFHATAQAYVGEIDIDLRVERLETEIASLKQSMKNLQRDTDKNTETV